MQRVLRIHWNVGLLIGIFRRDIGAFDCITCVSDRKSRSKVNRTRQVSVGKLERRCDPCARKDRILSALIAYASSARRQEVLENSASRGIQLEERVTGVPVDRSAA